MKKKLLIICILFFCFNINISVNAVMKELPLNDVNYVEENVVSYSNENILNLNVLKKTKSSGLYDEVTSASVNCSSLGLLRKDLQGIFQIFKILAPILVVVLSVYDFIKAIAGKVDGEIKKVFMKLLKRLAFAVILFFLPGILDFFLGLVDPGYSTCIN